MASLPKAHHLKFLLLTRMSNPRECSTSQRIVTLVLTLVPTPKWEEVDIYSLKGAKLARAIQTCPTMTSTVAEGATVSNITDSWWTKCQASLAEFRLTRASRVMVELQLLLLHYQIQSRCKEVSATLSALNSFVATLNSSNSFSRCTSSLLTTSWVLAPPPHTAWTSMETPTSSWWRARKSFTLHHPARRGNISET